MIDRGYRADYPKPVSNLLDLYDMFPFHQHPLWVAVMENRLSYEQIVAAESQHYLRTKEGQRIRRAAMMESRAVSPSFWEAIITTYIEECTDSDGTPTHLQLIEKLLLEGGLARDQFAALTPTPGNSAAIAIYSDIGSRGAGCHIIGAGMVEYYYSQLCPYIFRAYTQNYGFSSEAAATYEIHGPMDLIHANRALSIAEEAIEIYGYDLIKKSVTDAFIATSLHYDGMLQAANSSSDYWNGKFSV